MLTRPASGRIGIAAGPATPHGARSARRPPFGLLAGVLAILAMASLLPQPARAQCVPDATDPSQVLCSGNDPDGFDAGVDDDVDLVVLDDAVVANGANTDTIRLNDLSTITVESTAVVTNDAAGGAAASVVDNGFVDHGGAMTVSGDGGVGIRGQNGNTLNTGIASLIQLDGANTTGIQAGDDNAIVTNADIIGIGPGSTGVRVGSANTVGNAGIITFSGDDSIGVELVGNDNVFDHTGEIIVTGANSVGVLAGVGGGENNTILHSDLIMVGPGGGPAVSFAPSGTTGINALDTFGDSLIDAGSGTAVLGGEGTEVVRSEGELIGNVDLAGGDDTFQLFGTSSVTGDVDFGAGSDTFQLFGDATVTGSVDLGADDDTFLLSEGGVFSSIAGGAGTDAIELRVGSVSPDTLDLSTLSGFETLDLTGGDWTFQGSGLFGDGITLTNGIARIADPVSLTGNLSLMADAVAVTASTLEVADTLSLVGDYSQAAGSTLSAVIDPNGVSGSVVVTGQATIDVGSILDVVQTTPLGESGSFTILAASAGINGTFTELPADTAVLSFDVNTVDVVMGQEIRLEFLRSSYASAASTANQRAVGGALDEVRVAGPTGDLDLLLVSLDQVSTGEFGAALDTPHPEAYDAHTSTTLWFGRSFAGLAARNLVVCEPRYYEHVPDWIAQGRPCDADRWTPWIATFGSFPERDGGSGHISYSGQGIGIALGAARSFGADWEVSGYIGGGFGWLSVDKVGDGNLQMIDVGVAALRRIGGVQLRGALDYGHGFHDQERKAVVGTYVRKAKGEFGSDRVTGLLEASYEFEDSGPISLEPVASVDFTWLGEESFTESGGEGANLAVGDRSQTALSTTLGFKLEATLVKHRYVTESFQWANGVWRPALDLRWRGNWTDVDRKLSGRFVDAPAGTGSFQVKAKDAGQGAEVALGTTFQPYGTQVLVSTGYRGFIGDGSQVHTLGADVRIPF